MDMDQLQNNLEESLKELDIVIEEINKLNIKLNDVQDFIQKLKKNIESYKSKKKESHDQIKYSEVVSRLDKENKILKHELGIKNLNMRLMKDKKKSQPDFRYENTNLNSKLRKVTSELETTNLEYTKLLVKENLNKKSNILRIYIQASRILRHIL